MKKEQKIVDMAYDNTMFFLEKQTKHWGGKSGNFISYGLLNAVFEMIFYLAPSKENAMEIITMSLSNFLEVENEQ